MKEGTTKDRAIQVSFQVFMLQVYLYIHDTQCIISYELLSVRVFPQKRFFIGDG